jgi:pimeloyl-ACP methyl ester carboxylesterase
MRILLRLTIVAVLGLLLVPVMFRMLAYQREVQVASAAAPAGGRYVAGGDVKIFIQESGPADGPLVLLIHGTGAWSETWRRQLNALAQAGHHAVALDLPPFGYSERPATARYSKADQATRILGVLDALAASRAVLVGHSFGAGPTVEAALRASGRVRALVLVDAALGIAPDDGPPPAPSRIVASILRLPVRQALVSTFFTNPWFTRRLLRGFIADPGKATDARVQIYQQPLAVAGTTKAVAQWLPELVAPRTAAESESPAAYRRLTMPVVAIWGALDTVTPVAQGERLVSLVPHGRLEVLPDVGHIPQIEAPPACNAALLRALAEDAAP